MTERTDQTIILLHDVNETETLGRLLGAAAEAGDVLCLDGDLGAGKTTLTQAIARGLEVPAACYVTSPSFAVFQEYPGRLPLYHMDFYRLRGEDDVLDLGLEEYLYGSGLTVIEWSQRAPGILPEERLTLQIDGCGEAERRVAVGGGGRFLARMLPLLREFERATP